MTILLTLLSVALCIIWGILAVQEGLRFEGKMGRDLKDKEIAILLILGGPALWLVTAWVGFSMLFDIE